MRSKLPEKIEPASTYSKIAPVYDHLMRHVNYRQWFRYIESLVQTYRPNAQTILELACGTGIMLEKFTKRKRLLLGVDNSLEMLKAAQKRLAGTHSNFFLCCGDMSAFAIRSDVDVAICLYDSINYCLTESEFQAALESVHRSLRQDGLFIFDVCTRRTCKNYFRALYEKDTFDGIDYIRKGRYDNKNDWQINEFWLTNRCGNGETFFERHIQKIYLLKTIKKFLLQNNKWKILGIYHNFTRRPGTERSFRVHFVVRKI
ncbi:MAG: class I SAM-dependent DNA methyltransferase [bacterium]